MFEVLENIPAYSSRSPTHITRQAYDKAVNSFIKHLEKAFERFEAYWRTDNNALFDMSLEELLKASRFMDIIVCIADEKTIEKLSKRATFMYDLAAAMMGATN